MNETGRAGAVRIRGIETGMWNSRLKILSLAVVSAALYGMLIAQSIRADAPKPLRRFDFHRVEMGVEFRITLYACDSAVANHAAKAAFDRIHELNSKLSDYDSSSEVRRLCEMPAGQWRPVSTDLHKVLACGKTLSGNSHGAFDYTVGHYTKLWRRARRQKQLPSQEQLKAVRPLTGFQLVEVQVDHSRVRLLRDRMRIDLGGIAKGFAVDEALRILTESGIQRALVDGSGDLAVSAPPPGKSAWRIEIAALRGTVDEKPVSVEISHCAVATSGDAFQAIEIDGTRYSHIVDPKTGMPLTTPSSVTVVARTGMEADSLASAISVLGPEAGIQFAENRDDTEAFVVTAQGSTFQRAETTGFRLLKACGICDAACDPHQ